MNKTIDVIQDRIKRMESHSSSLLKYINNVLDRGSIPSEKAQSERFRINEEVAFLRELIIIMKKEASDFN